MIISRNGIHLQELGGARFSGAYLNSSVAFLHMPWGICWSIFWRCVSPRLFLSTWHYQVRCMAAINPRTATLGCLIGGCFTFFIGIPFSYLGAITRYDNVEVRAFSRIHDKQRWFLT